ETVFCAAPTLTCRGWRVETWATTTTELRHCATMPSSAASALLVPAADTKRPARPDSSARQAAVQPGPTPSTSAMTPIGRAAGAGEPHVVTTNTCWIPAEAAA